ncbi:MAG TPA: lysophospholipid acyltransferase family protein [Thermoleophilaceae bacterium]|nr:lysophospholipid acyltransferase family protein [Thermoleophilaceae bacterium]
MSTRVGDQSATNGHTAGTREAHSGDRSGPGAGGRGGGFPGAFPIGPAISFLRRLRGGLDSGRELPVALAEAGAVLPRDLRHALDRLTQRLAGDYEEDEWGFDEEFADALLPFLDFLYDRWWRVETIGARGVPSHGRAMLVANHAGILPWDATMISLGLVREHPLPRYPRFLVLDWAFTLPYVSVAMRKLGGVVASPYNALRLLEQDELVAVFPEGIKGAGKPFRERYRLQRFGRGGFVEIALRTGAPIVPVAVVGSEEIYPKLGEAPALARLLRMPYFPLTPTFPLLGLLGTIPLPSRWRIEFGDPIDTARFGPEAAEDRSFVFELSEQVREAIQGKVYDNLVARGSAFI